MRKSKILLHFSVCIACSCVEGTAQTWVNGGSTTSKIYRDSKVAIGTGIVPDDPNTSLWHSPSVSPMFEVNSLNSLGTMLFDRALISSQGGVTGVNGGSIIRQALWLFRNSNIVPGPNYTNPWENITVHEGISVDNSFVNPVTDSRTWWRRDAYSGKQSWGDMASTMMELNGQGNMNIGNISSTSARLAVQHPTNARLEVYTTGGSANSDAEIWVANSVRSYGLMVDGTGAGHITQGISSKLHLLGFENVLSTQVPRPEVWIGPRLSWPSHHNLEILDNNAGLLVYNNSSQQSGKAVINVGNNQGMYGLSVDGQGVGHIIKANDMNYKVINLGWYSASQSINDHPQVWIGKRPDAQFSTHADFTFAAGGKLVAQEVIVTQQNWADYVFDENYELMPLKDLETYYKCNKRLPLIPSTGEITEKGNSLGETDVLLLRKIEELTLYLVQQEKKYEEQRVKLISQEKRIEALERSKN